MRSILTRVSRSRFNRSRFNRSRFNRSGFNRSGRDLITILATAGILCLASVPIPGIVGSAFAQAKAPAQAEPADDAGGPIDQIALTEKQVLGVIAAQKQIADVTAKLSESDRDQPSPKVQAKLDGIAKASGFADFAAYDAVASNVGLVLTGFDPETKTYVGPEAVIKKQIAEVKADKQMPAKDKKEALDQLNASLKAAAPVKYPDNIKLVTKYYDKLSEGAQQD
jgi:hypothetical protein